MIGLRWDREWAALEFPLEALKWKRNARLIEINFNYLLNKLWNFEHSNNRDDRIDRHDVYVYIVLLDCTCSIIDFFFG